MSRRAARPAGPVTPGTDQLVGAWSRVDAGRASRPAEAEPASPTAHADAGAVSTAPAGARESDDAAEPRRTGGPTRSGRRVTTAAVPGSDPTPAPEPARHGAGENDDRLLRDRPPHWG